MTERFNADAALAPLKDFQRATADHVFHRLYGDDDPVRRFLIADEVGLGKTLVARGVIAQALEHLQDVVDQVNVIYVCSNAQIARQNIRRLRIEQQSQFELAERITMLPATAHRLADNPVNLISFTPGTSFELKRGTGIARERALIRLMLAEVWGHDRFHSHGSLRMFQGGVRTLSNFRGVYRELERAHAKHLSPELVAAFAATLETAEDGARAAGNPGPRERFEELRHLFSHARPSGRPRKHNHLRNRFIGDLRDLLARSCLQALRPSLIILDEFQRFKHLLRDPNGQETSAAAELAHELFEHADEATGDQARVLLLSATPYKMHTNHHDEDDDHHRDLVDTVRFLLEHDTDAVERLRGDLRAMRHGLLQLGQDGGDAARRALAEVETTLRRVMVRTERLASTATRSGMLESRPTPGVTLRSPEVASYVALSQLATHLQAPDPLEYWKSAPYLLNFADGYKIHERFVEAAEADDPLLARLVEAAGVLDVEAMRRFEPIDLDHPRLRWLLEDTVGRGAWQLLWIPPSLPYLQLTGPFADPELQTFTKRLVFSSWKIVPTAIATLLTYETERRMVTAAGPARFENRPEARTNRARLLDFRFSDNRLTGMPVLALLYPSVVLAEVGDLRRLARNRDGALLSVDEALTTVASRIQRRLDELDATGLVTDDPTRGDDGREDERWYWAAPLLLDRHADLDNGAALFTDIGILQQAYLGKEPGDDVGRFREHLQRAAEVAIGSDPVELGRPPKDLAAVLARLALAGPAVTAARALAQATERQYDDVAVRHAACRAAWGFRSLFNSPEVTELLHHLHPGEPYWQRTLDYSLSGDLQAVLDEYAFVLVSSQGHLDLAEDKVAMDLATAIHDAVRLRTVPYGITRIDVSDTTVTLPKGETLRANLALRLTGDRSDGRSQIREGSVREAFNSPFRPFVLATTSAGQEGLDFHPYSHAVVHWNLPGNPVDIEQREGRVHRFQGHAVRRNVAGAHAIVGRTASGSAWRAMFEVAHDQRDHDATDIIPYWVYVTDDGTAVHRYVPALPLSRDRSHAEALQRAVASYRLAFGQPRQEDLLAYVATQVDEETLERLAADIRVDLSPNGRVANSSLLSEQRP